MSALFPVALRDTALTISELAHMSEQPSGWATQLRDDCEEQIDRLRDELYARGLSLDQIDDAALAQCALLDEVALRSLVGDARDEWEQSPLQLRAFKINDAGEELVRRIEQRLREARPVKPLFAIFGAVLDLGFTGRLTLDGDDARAKLRRALDERLGVLNASRQSASNSGNDAPLVIKAPIARSWTQRLSPLGCVALACVATGLVWLAVNSWLNASVTRLTH